MRKRFLPLLASLLAFGCVLGLSAVSKAALILEGSVGQGGEVSPATHTLPTNIMLAPGVEALSLLRLELGLVADLPDVKASKFDLQLRPMIVVAPPFFPLYVRAIFAVQNMLHHTEVAYGGALGLRVALMGIGLFAEAGLLPRDVDHQFQWIVEGRLGAYVTF